MGGYWSDTLVDMNMDWESLRWRNVAWELIPPDSRMRVVTFLSVEDNLLGLNQALTTKKDKLRKELKKSYKKAVIPAFDTHRFTDQKAKHKDEEAEIRQEHEAYERVGGGDAEGLEQLGCGARVGGDGLCPVCTAQGQNCEETHDHRVLGCALSTVVWRAVLAFWKSFTAETWAVV